MKSTYTLWCIVLVTVLLTACSTKKNTAGSRFWQSFTTRYNVYYNGSLAYIDASLEKENGNKDNYTELIPLYTIGNKDSRSLGSGNYDKAIEKAQKAIKLHSISARPRWTKQRPKNEKEIEWYSRKEYNPFIWKAWMLMGRSQFYKGEFDDAAATFAWMSRLYKTQPAIYGKARAWLAKCYIEQDWLYDAEDIIRNMSRDSIDWRAQKEWDYTYADYYLHTGELDKASQYLRKVIKHEMRSKQRAREWYLLGQIEAARGNKQEAYQAFRKVIRQNPPYELEFNARISMTEVLAQGQAKQMISRLKRMARNDNNKDYLDQVYYAMGNIYLAQRDTTKAISAYENGNRKATRSGIEKGVLLLHLGDLYWEKEKYSDAQRCYGEAIGLLDKERKDYQQLSERSKVLDELVPYTDAIHLQDSLQALAQMSEKDRNAAIDRVIAELKRKEKEEKDKLAEEAAQKAQANAPKPNGAVGNTLAQRPINNQNQTWYFYNTMAVQQGKMQFERQWGKRENVDDWQRSNRTVVGGLFGDAQENDPMENLTDEQRDSIAAAEKAAEELAAKMDTAANNPHKREYYLAQIPFTPEKVAESNEIIKDGLFHSGIIFKDKLDNMPLSSKQFERLMNQYSDFEPMDEVYYHMFLLHSRMGEIATAQTYVERLKTDYPKSKWTAIVTDPYFAENARFGKHIEDSLYAATYNAFLAERHKEVMSNTHISDTRFIMGDHRDKFIFISGLSLLNTGKPDSCLKRMEQVVKDFPKSSVSTIAGMIINGVKEGRKLRGANFSMADVWNRRTAVMSDGDSIEGRTFSDERDAPFVFMFVYNPDSIAENQLLYQLARFNFTTFVVRNFELQIEQADGLHWMEVSGFRSFDEARLYANVLYASSDAIKGLVQKCRPVIISERNMELLGSHFSYNDYDTFYTEHYQPLAIDREYMLYEPDERRKEDKAGDDVVPILPSENVAPGGVAPVAPKSESEEEEGSTDNDIEIPEDTTIELPATEDVIIEDTPVETPATEDVIIEDTPVETPVTDEIIIEDATPTENVETEEIIIEDTQVENSSAEEIIVVDTDDDAPASNETVVEDKSESEKKDDKSAPAKDDKVKSDKKEDKSDKKDGKSEKKSDKKDGKSEPENNDESESETIIIIEDKKPSTDEIEDEYYELEGF